jgi:hypothetical protein
MMEALKPVPGSDAHTLPAIRFERDYISTVLARHNSRMSDVAAELGLERANLYRKMRPTTRTLFKRWAGLASRTGLINSQPWMRYAGMIETGDPRASQTIDDVVYGQKD